MKFPLKIRINSAHIDFLQENRVFTSRSGKPDDSWLKIGSTITISGAIVVEPYTEFQRGPNFHSMGSFSFSRSSFGAGVGAGRYTVMADGIQLMRHAHPTDRLTFANIDYPSTHACFAQAVKDSGKPPLAGKPWSNLPRPNVVIGHSAWIGADALIKRSVSIGTGALVAARSVVTKDVPPYAMVAGNPARLRGPFDGFRHPPELVARLLASRWWEYRFTNFHALDTTDPERFLDGFEPAVAAGDLMPYRPNPIHLHEVFSSLA